MRRVLGDYSAGATATRRRGHAVSATTILTSRARVGSMTVRTTRRLREYRATTISLCWRRPDARAIL